jgi:uncharacterized coiled-coil DUF342 family protein
LRALAVALAAVALLAAGCGGDGDDADDSAAPSKTAYAEKGNTICRTAQTQVDALPTAQPPTLEDLREKTPEARRRLKLWTEYSTKIDDIGRKSQTDLLALEPPAELRQRREQLRKDLEALDKAGAEANEAGNKLRAAARSEDDAALETARAQAQQIANRQGAIAERIRTQFGALGWTACVRTQ